MCVFNRRLSNHVSTSIPLVVLRVEHHVSLDCLWRYGWMKFPGKKTVKWANLAGKLMANWLSQKVRQGMIFASSSTAEGELPIPFLCHADSAQCAIWGRFLTSSPAIPQYSTRGLRELSLLEVLFVPLDCRSVAWWSSIMELQHRMQWCRLFWCGFTMDMFFFVPSSWDYSIMRRGWKAYVWSSSKLVLFWKNRILWFVAKGAYDYLCTLRSCVTCAFVQSVLASGEKCKEIGCDNVSFYIW